jgi:hypothetical protein
MISSTGLVHTATLFVIGVIVVAEIKLGKDHCSWLPILTTLVGYLLPQPQFTNARNKQPTSSSMLHLDPEFVPLQNIDNPDGDVGATAAVATAGDGGKVDELEKEKSYQALFFESLPSVALLTAIVVWAAISLTSHTNVPPPPPSTGITTQAPYIWQNPTVVTTALYQHTIESTEHAERFGTSSVCDYLLRTAELNGLCGDAADRLEHTVEITNGTLGMCYVKKREIAAKIMLANGTFTSAYTGWRLLLFRMSRISDRLYKTICNEMSIGYRNETASSCNGRVTITGYPEQISLSAQQWNDMVFYIPDVLLAMLGCQRYTNAGRLTT